MTPEVGRVDRHDDEVTSPRRDLTFAAGAEVLLRRLVRLDAPDLERPAAVVLDPGHEPSSAHARSNTTTTTAAATMT